MKSYWIWFFVLWIAHITGVTFVYWIHPTPVVWIIGAVTFFCLLMTAPLLVANIVRPVNKTMRAYRLAHAFVFLHVAIASGLLIAILALAATHWPWGGSVFSLEDTPTFLFLCMCDLALLTLGMARLDVTRLAFACRFGYIPVQVPFHSMVWVQLGLISVTSIIGGAFVVRTIVAVPLVMPDFLVATGLQALLLVWVFACTALFSRQYRAQARVYRLVRQSVELHALDHEDHNQINYIRA